MKILVLGAGAIGSVFAGFLSKAGHDVCIVGRKDHIDAIKENGLLIDGIWGLHTVKGIKGYLRIDDIPESCDNKFDVVLLTVKSYDTEAMLREFKKLFSDLPPVVSLQNGLGNIDKVEELIGKKKTIGGRVIFGVEFISPGHVSITVSADRTVIGGLINGIEKEFVKKLADTFTLAGVPTDVTDDINRFVWGKVLYNCALNGLATILDENYGKLIGCDGTKIIMRGIIEEVFIVLKAKGICLDQSTTLEYEKLLFSELIPKTNNHHPSMLQDIKRGKKTEIDALNGAIVKMGMEMGLDLPHNRIVTQFVKASE